MNDEQPDEYTKEFIKYKALRFNQEIVAMVLSYTTLIAAIIYDELLKSNNCDLTELANSMAELAEKYLSVSNGRYEYNIPPLPVKDVIIEEVIKMVNHKREYENAPLSLDCEGYIVKG